MIMSTVPCVVSVAGLAMKLPIPLPQNLKKKGPVVERS